MRPPVRLGGRVGTQALGQFQGMGHRLHALGIHAFHLLHEVKDVRQGAGVGVQVLFPHVQTCQVGDLLDLFL